MAAPSTHRTARSTRKPPILRRIRQDLAIPGAVPALVYLASYLTLILPFSLIFYALPAQDFQPASDLPSRQQGEREVSILHDLRDEIRRTYAVNGASGLVVNSWRMLPEQADVAFLHTSLPLSFDF